jgi:DNA-directed RNA polymerase subunit M/transcription elongation factor TFIIS
MQYCRSCEKFYKDSCLTHTENKVNLVPDYTKKIVEKPTPPKTVYSQFPCQYCKELKVTVTVRQIRGLDEAPTVFYYCHSCKKTTREN